MMKAKVIKYSSFFFFYSCKTVKLNKVSSTPIFCVSCLPSYCLIMLRKRRAGSIPVTVLNRILYRYVSVSLKFVLNLITWPTKQVLPLSHRLLKTELQAHLYEEGAVFWSRSSCLDVQSSPSRTSGPVNRDGMKNVECGVRLPGGM